MLFRYLYAIADRFEDKTRARLSHVPLIYAALGGVGIILFWRGIWHTADYLVGRFFAVQPSVVSAGVPESPWWDGPLSVVLGSALLLSIGLFVTSFIGDAILVSGQKNDKRLTEKTEKAILTELRDADQIHAEIREISERVQSFERSMGILAAQRKTERLLKTRRRAKTKTADERMMERKS